MDVSEEQIFVGRDTRRRESSFYRPALKLLNHNESLGLETYPRLPLWLYKILLIHPNQVARSQLLYNSIAQEMLITGEPTIGPAFYEYSRNFPDGIFDFGVWIRQLCLLAYGAIDDVAFYIGSVTPKSFISMPEEKEAQVFDWLLVALLTIMNRDVADKTLYQTDLVAKIAKVFKQTELNSNVLNRLTEILVVALKESTASSLALLVSRLPIQNKGAVIHVGVCHSFIPYKLGGEDLSTVSHLKNLFESKSPDDNLLADEILTAIGMYMKALPLVYPELTDSLLGLRKALDFHVNVDDEVRGHFIGEKLQFIRIQHPIRDNQ